jgi:hypothetical protein
VTKPARLVAAAVSLHADLVASEVVRSLHAIEVDPILLRGPALARTLYEDGNTRAYTDVDLLVARRDVSRVEARLSGLGFVDRTVEGVIAGDRPTYAHTWVRPEDGATVDLHYTLLGVGLEPDEAWEILTGLTEPLLVAGESIRALRPPGCVIVIALHAAAHGARVRKPLQDLERAIVRLSPETWREGASVAAQLRATSAFATGLSLIPTGEALAEELDLAHVVSSTEVRLRARTAPPMALGFEWLAQTRGTRAKATLVVRKMAPPATFMRAWSPLARRGRAGLMLSYVARIAWLARQSVPALAFWLRARAGSR